MARWAFQRRRHGGAKKLGTRKAEDYRALSMDGTLSAA